MVWVNNNINLEDNLSLFSLKKSVELELAKKVSVDYVKDNHGENIRLKVLSANDFTDVQVQDLTKIKKLHQLDLANDTYGTHVPVTKEPGLTLMSTDVEGELAWQPFVEYRHTADRFNDVERYMHLSEADRTKLTHMITMDDATAKFMTNSDAINFINDAINDVFEEETLIGTLTTVKEFMKDAEGNASLLDEMIKQIKNKVSIELRADGRNKTLTSNDFTDNLKFKLDNLTNYNLPAATNSSLGGLIVGNGLKTNDSGLVQVDDTIYASERKIKENGGWYQLPIASNTTIGAVTVSPVGGLSIDQGTGMLRIDLEAIRNKIAQIVKEVVEVEFLEGKNLAYLDTHTTYTFDEEDFPHIRNSGDIFHYGKNIFNGAEGVIIDIPFLYEFVSFSATPQSNDAGDIWFTPTIESNGFHRVTVYNNGSTEAEFSYILIVKAKDAPVDSVVTSPKFTPAEGRPMTLPEDFVNDGSIPSEGFDGLYFE